MPDKSDTTASFRIAAITLDNRRFYEAGIEEGYRRVGVTPETMATQAAATLLLDDAVDFLRRRHNYGPRRREEIRLDILKRYTALRECAENAE